MKLSAVAPGGGDNVLATSEWEGLPFLFSPSLLSRLVPCPGFSFHFFCIISLLSFLSVRLSFLAFWSF